MKNNKASVLKVKGGKYVTVRLRPDGVKLCALDSQNEHLVNIYTQQKDGKIQMAFCFHHKSGCYSLEVAKKGIKLQWIASPPPVSSLRNEHWFEKVTQSYGEHFFLQPVGESTQYLSFEESSASIVCHTEKSKNGLFTYYSA